MKRYVALFLGLLLTIAWAFSTIQPTAAQDQLNPWRAVIAVCTPTAAGEACTRWITTTEYPSSGACFADAQTQAQRLVDRAMLERPGRRINAYVRCFTEPTA